MLSEFLSCLNIFDMAFETTTLVGHLFLFRGYFFRYQSEFLIFLISYLAVSSQKWK